MKTHLFYSILEDLSVFASDLDMTHLQMLRVQKVRNVALVYVALALAALNWVRALDELAKLTLLHCMVLSNLLVAMDLSQLNPEDP